MSDLFTDPTQLNARLLQLQQQLDDLARSMIAAKNATPPNQQALDMFRTQYRQVAAQLAALRTQANQADAPSAFLLALDTVSDVAIATGKQLGVDVSDTLHTGVTLVKMIPWLIAAIVLIVGYGIYKGRIKVHV